MDSNSNLPSGIGCDASSGELLSSILHTFSSHKVGLREYEVSTRSPRFLNDFFHVMNLVAIGVKWIDMESQRASIHPEDLPAFDVMLDTLCQGKVNNTFIRYRCQGNNGQIVWLEEHFTAIPESNPAKIVSFSFNVDKRKEHEDNVRLTEEKYRKLVNTLPDFIFVFDENFVFKDIIMAEGMSLLHTREELIGTSGKAIFTEDVSALYEANIRECLRTGELKEIEYYLLINNFKYFFQARIVPFENDQVFALIHDIGDRVKRMEELLEARRKAEEADRLKSAFLANMSHEIRTPLNAIVGFTEVVAAEDDPQMRAEYMDVIRNNNNLLLQLINDILDLSRIESGKCEIKFQSTDINHLVDEVHKTYQMRMKPGVELILDSPEEEIWTLTDHNRVTQILFNLLSNAIKNTDKGSITIKLGLEGHYIRLSVIDTGRGIPEDKLTNIFHRFEKVNDNVQGTGLGLAICESLVQRLGGEIGVQSVFGAGSTFYFTIPYRNTPGHACGIEDDSEEKRKKILVAEDNQDNFNFIKDVIQKSHDVDVIWAANGEDAVNSFVLESPSLILMNIQLPIMNGIDATQRIRTMSANIPIIGITSNSFYMERQWAQESGCNEIMSKPYSASKIEEIVLAFLK